MKFTIERETFLKPLQAVQGVVERRQTLPILSNLLLSATGESLSLTATDMEVELGARVAVPSVGEGEVTVPARKLIDICRSLPPSASIDFALDGDRVIVKSGRSRFTLSTLPAADFPTTDDLVDEISFSIPRGELKQLIDLTQFAMAHQDVRYYLNGLLLEISPDLIRAVATDGHRLAVSQVKVETPVTEPRSIIVPRKGVVELGRLLDAGDEPVEFKVGSNAVQVQIGDTRLTSKLIDGKFPDYERVIPDAEKCDKHVRVDKESLRQCLARASILSNDKYRAVRMTLEPGVLKVVANNPEQEVAEDELEVDYQGESLEIGFNVSYLIDALSTLPSESSEIFLTDSSSSCLIQPESSDSCQFVVMPMRL